MKILDKLNIPDNKCPYCTFQQSKKFSWDFLGKFRGESGDGAQLEYDSEDQEDFPGITLNAYLGSDSATTQISYCPWCGRKLN